MSEADNSGFLAKQGFALIEVVCTIAILGLLFAIVLPAIPLGTSRSRLEGYALQTAELLKVDRNASIRRQTPVETSIDVVGRAVRSGATGRLVALPRDVTIEGLLAARCAGQTIRSAIRFLPSGLSCGGAIALTRNGFGYEIRVNWLTGGIQVAPLSERQT